MWLSKYWDLAKIGISRIFMDFRALFGFQMPAGTWNPYILPEFPIFARKPKKALNPNLRENHMGRPQNQPDILHRSYMIHICHKEPMPDKKFRRTVRTASLFLGTDWLPIRPQRIAHCKWGTVKVCQLAVFPLVDAFFNCRQKCLFLWFCQSIHLFFQKQFISTFWKLTICGFWKGKQATWFMNTNSHYWPDSTWRILKWQSTSSIIHWSSSRILLCMKKLF